MGGVTACGVHAAIGRQAEKAVQVAAIERSAVISGSKSALCPAGTITARGVAAAKARAIKTSAAKAPAAETGSVKTARANAAAVKAASTEAPAAEAAAIETAATKAAAIKTAAAEATASEASAAESSGEAVRRQARQTEQKTRTTEVNMCLLMDITVMYLVV